MAENQKQSGGVESPSVQYEYMAEKWELPLDLMKGVKVMRDKKYLPQEPAESKEAHKIRLERSSLFNVFKQTVKGSAGQALKNPIVAKNVPDELKFLVDNATGDGQSMTEVAYDMIEHHLLYGKSHAIVDFPAWEGEPMSYTEFKHSGFKPYINVIDPVNLIGWKYNTRIGYPKLDSIRIVETEFTEDPANQFYVGERKQVRVYYNDAVHVWLYNEDDAQYVVEQQFDNTLGFVPLVTGYANKTGFMMAEPPLESLAETNLTHFQSSSDQRSILHTARVGFILATGFGSTELENLEIGSNRVVTTTNENADMKYVEHGGEAINAGKDDLEALEQHMQVLGAAVITDKSSDRQTVGARQIDQAQAMSLLQLSIRSTARMLEDAFMIAGLWLGIDASEVKVSIGDDMSLPNEPNPTAAWMAMKDGPITEEEWFNEGKRRGIIRSDVKFVANQSTEPEPVVVKEDNGDEEDTGDDDEENEKDE